MFFLILPAGFLAGSVLRDALWPGVAGIHNDGDRQGYGPPSHVVTVGLDFAKKLLSGGGAWHNRDPFVP